ncbi:MAG: hypothetical protein IJZ75_02870 [Clostridia bacterium]|nr:hypothetical protein [Clostridia bacterium]
MSFAFFLSFIFAAVLVYLIYSIIKSAGREEYTKTLGSFLLAFVLCGIGVYLLLNFTDYMAQCLAGALSGFVLCAIGSFIFKQFCPYTLKELWEISKKFLTFCYQKAKIYTPVIIKFIKEKSVELYKKIRLFIENRRK